MSEWPQGCWDIQDAALFILQQQSFEPVFPALPPNLPYSGELGGDDFTPTNQK